MAARKEIPRELSIYINDKAVVNSLGGITREITKTNYEMKALNKNSATYDDDLRKLQGTLGELKSRQSDFKNEIYQTNSLFGKMSQLLGPVATGLLSAFSIGAVIGTFAAAVSNAFKMINAFEQGVADLSAITGATGDNLQYLKEQAIELGKSTKGGAIEVLEAYKLIASAKPELLDNVEALNAVTAATITLAQAAGMEMPAAATALTDAMNQFGADANQAAIFVDALANGAKYGAAEIPQVTEALLKFGAVARSSNVSIQESTALVELLAENGLKGAEAGTALRNVLLKLSAPDALPKEARAEMERLGISMEFLKDKTIPVQEKMEALKPLLKDNASIVKVFGLENATAAINVIGHTDRLAELTSKMGEMGTAAQQAAIKMDTVNGQTELMKSTYDSLILSIGSGNGVVSGFFKFFAQGATSMLNDLIRLNTSWDDLKGKAMEKGAQTGKVVFAQRLNSLQGTGSNKEIAGSIKTTAFVEYQRLQKQYLANEEEIKKRAGDSAYLGLGESSFLKKAKEEKEKLAGQLAEQRAIVRESLKEINKDSKAASTEKIKDITDATSAITTAEQKGADKVANAKEKAAAKEKVAEDKKNKESLDAALALAKAKGDLAKSELDFFVANNKSKLDSTKSLTPELIAEETSRLDAIKDKQLTALAEERLAKVEKAQADAKSDEELVALKQIIDFDYETKKQELETGFQVATDVLKKTYIDEQKVLAAEQLLLDNELALAEAGTKTEEEALKRQFAYDKEKADYKKLLDDNKITQEESNRFIVALDKQKEEDTRLSKINSVSATLKELSKVADATVAIFGQNKASASAMAAINGGLAVTEILATKSVLPEPLASISRVIQIAGAVATTIRSISQINSAKAPARAKFFHGGNTGNYAALGYDEYGPMTGIVHKNEYVIPEVMTANPRYANTLAWLEQERTGKTRKFVDGGATSPGIVPTGGFTNINNSTSKMESMLGALLFRLENPIPTKTVIGYAEAQGIETLNSERAASTQNGIISG
ncbi:phage tail tape measure protein [Flavobacterium sp. LB3P122]|uniref:phage tail tape measure protein n=1 Tax=Flavobacterium algoriphilum TaxID=3398738 RepID=UPI003A843232